MTLGYHHFCRHLYKTIRKWDLHFLALFGSSGKGVLLDAFEALGKGASIMAFLDSLKALVKFCFRHQFYMSKMNKNTHSHLATTIIRTHSHSNYSELPLIMCRV